MSRVLCKLPNASTLIDGIKFEKQPQGMLSEEISDEQVKYYLSIPGFSEVPTPKQTQSLVDAKATAPAPNVEEPKVAAPATDTAPPAVAATPAPAAASLVGTAASAQPGAAPAAPTF